MVTDGDGILVTGPEMDASTGELSIYISKAVFDDVEGSDERDMHGVVALQLSLDRMWVTLETVNTTEKRRNSAWGYAAVAYRSQVCMCVLPQGLLALLLHKKQYDAAQHALG
jgi:hypothetical protein